MREAWWRRTLMSAWARPVLLVALLLVLWQVVIWV
jgi:hypothetical protein